MNVFCGILMLFVLAACSSVEPLQTPSAETLPARVTTGVQPTPMTPRPPTDLPGAAAEETMLRIWIPEPLAPIDDEDAADILSEQISGFLAINPNIIIELRLKRDSDVGGILSTLNNANAVARDALPNLTLLRRSDLMIAVQNNLIMSWDEMAPSLTVIDPLTPTIVGLGTVNERLYGLPYALDGWHATYEREFVRDDVTTFDAVLEAQIPFWFPLEPSSTISETLYTQIVAAGGIFGNDGSLTIDRAALEAIFRFYADAVAQGIISPENLTAASPGAYEDRLLTGDRILAVIDARTYRRLSARNDALVPIPIPSQSGAAASIIDGWMWVMVIPPDDTSVITAYLNWMFDAERQAAYTDAISAVPSSSAARALWQDQAYAAFIETQLERVAYPITGESSAAARIVQDALFDVLNGSLSPQEAAETVLTQTRR